MNNLDISTDPSLLNVDLASSMTTSPSVSTFMPEEDASICPLLPSTPSPPPIGFIHPLTPNTGNDDNCNDNEDNFIGDDGQADTSSSGSSSGIGIQVTGTGPSSIFNKHAYQHLGKNGDIVSQENGLTQNDSFSIPITKDTPSFVAWNWPVIRKCTFYLFISALLAMCAIVVAMIMTMPKLCNPDTEWHKGGVFYEIFPASFQDSNGDGLGDLKGLANRADYLKNLGIRAVRLNSIFPAQHYPDHFQDVTTLMEIDEILGKPEDLSLLASTLHVRNISLILDLPIYPFMKQLDLAMNDSSEQNGTESNYHETEFFRSSRNVINNENIILTAMRLWLSKGVDGFYIKGLEHFANDPNLLDNIREWKFALGSDRILIVSKTLLDKLNENIIGQVLQNVDLVDVFLDVTNGTQTIAEQIQSNIFSRHLSPGFNPWIHWSIGSVSESRISKGLLPNATLAATLMQLMLPGTPSIFYGDEISLQEVNDPLGEHSDTKHLHHLSTMAWNSRIQFTNKESLPWLPRGASQAFHHFDYISNMILLRERSPSIYLNAVIKDCQAVLNTAVRYSENDVLILERWYPRRHTFVTVTNLGHHQLSLDLSGMFYSGDAMLGPGKAEKILFNDFQIKPMETVVAKLDK